MCERQELSGLLVTVLYMYIYILYIYIFQTHESIKQQTQIYKIQCEETGSSIRSLLDSS